MRFSALVVPVDVHPVQTRSDERKHSLKFSYIFLHKENWGRCILPKTWWPRKHRLIRFPTKISTYPYDYARLHSRSFHTNRPDFLFDQFRSTISVQQDIFLSHFLSPKSQISHKQKWSRKQSSATRWQIRETCNYCVRTFNCRLTWIRLEFWKKDGKKSLCNLCLCRFGTNRGFLHLSFHTGFSIDLSSFSLGFPSVLLILDQNFHHHLLNFVFSLEFFNLLFSWVFSSSFHLQSLSLHRNHCHHRQNHFLHRCR